MTFDKSLRGATHRLSEKSGSQVVPDGLRANILSRLPNQLPQTGTHTNPVFTQAVSLCAFACLAAIGGTAWYRTLPHKRPLVAVRARATPPAAPKFDPTVELRNKVGVAIENVNSWHLSFRNYANEPDDSFGAPHSPAKPVTQWEIWGQRKPFVYRKQQSGEMLIISDGKRTQFAPASDSTSAGAQPGAPRIHHPKVVVVESNSGQTTSSENAPTSMDAFDGNGFMQTFVAIPRPSSRAALGTSPDAVRDSYAATASYSLAPPTPNKNSVIIKRVLHEKGLLYEAEMAIDPLTSLPERYSETDDIGPIPPSAAISHQGEVVDASFNRPLPTNLVIAAPDRDAIVVNIVPTSTKTTASGRMPATIRDLAVRLDVAETDAEGDVSYRPEWTIGGKPISLDALFDMFHFSIVDLSVMDDFGRHYLPIDGFGSVKAGQKIAIIAPVEPLVAGSPPPRLLSAKFTLEFSGLSSRKVSGSGSKYETAMVLTTDLSSMPIVAAHNSHSILGVGDPSLRLRIFESRSIYYLLGADQESPAATDQPARKDRNNASGDQSAKPMVGGATAGQAVLPILTPENNARAVYWTNRVVDEATRDGKKGVARYYAGRLKSLGLD